MSVFEKYVNQCRKPTGFFGRFVGRSMNVGHSRLMRWGLGHISIKDDASILDIGCGGGKAVKELAGYCLKGKVYGIDYSEDMVQLSREVNRELVEKGCVEILHASVSSLPFEDNMLDIVTAFETYYFWPDLIEDLKEIKRILKPGGILLMANEAYEQKEFEKRNGRWADWAGMMLHTPDGYRNFLAEAGYREVEIDNLPDKNWISALAKK